MSKKSRGSGRPARPVVTLLATAEEIARRFFGNARPPNPDRLAEDRQSYQSDKKAERDD